MNLAVNYSHVAEQLCQRQLIHFDYFKFPAWPDLVNKAMEKHPLYVHFPLAAGLGIRDAMDTETRRPADWKKMESLLVQTATPFINVHLAPRASDFPDIAANPNDHIEQVTQRLILDVQAVIQRFGAERVIVENVYEGNTRHLRQACLAEVIRQVVYETGCGFLFDLSHARLAARDLKWDAKEYIQQLPMDRVQEIHVTGIQLFSGAWIQRVRQANFPEHAIRAYEGRLVDHLPLTDEDWDFYAWTMNQIHSGVWKKPWVVTFEYGGVDTFWEATLDESVLLEQVPRLQTLMKPT